MAEDLGLAHPRTYRERVPPDARLPLVAKPIAGSCGRGFRLLTSPTDVRRLAPDGVPPRRFVVQEWVDSGTPYAVSFRVITVRDRVVAAALFYSGLGRPSNLSMGGRAIPFSGTHRASRLTREETAVLEQLGFGSRLRQAPAALLDSARRAGRWLSERGVQIAGHDFIPDGHGGWLYLEANAYPGYLVFAATDGDRRKRLLSGYYRAAETLARTIAEEFAW
jgi:glutathione synthase/RimK-type ligase-like ATP-grasp enzyme